MNKKVMQDMQSRGPRLTQIKREDIADTHTYSRDTTQKISSRPTVRRPSRGHRRYVILFLLAAILVGAYFICNYFENAHIDIVAKHSSMTLNQMPFNVSNDPNAKIHFELMIVNDTATKSMTLTQSQNASVKAQGQITIYNEFSSKPVVIAAHTFVADPDGKAYQTDQAVTIPGFTTNQSVVTPGQANISITAFLPGDTYNGSPTDFTITSYKGTPRDKKIYAKLATPITGGAQGLAYLLSPEDKGMLDAYAGSTFKSNLLKKAIAEVPPGYILYPNALTFSYQVDQNTLSKTPDAKVNVSGSISAVILNSQDLSSAIINNLLPGISNAEFKEIEIPDINKLSFNFTDANQAITKDMQSVSFTLTGPVNPVWHPDVDTMKSNIVGINKNAVMNLFESDPGITSAHINIFPPWQSDMPQSRDKIRITVE